MLESLNTNNLEYQKLTKDEMSRRGILGRLVGACADIINPTRNGRKYSEKLWENVFEDPIMKERIENGVCYGELGHPADREETDMEKIAVCLAEVPKKGTDGKLRAVFDILNTPNGRILKSLCDYGSTLGISSRGSGDLEVGYDGQESVNPDTYNCEGFDIVLIPAVKDARLEYVTESLDKKRYNKTLRQKLQESIDKETEDHQKIMRESLDNLGIDLKYDDTAETSDDNLIKSDVNEAWTGTDDIVYGMFNSEPEGQEKVYVDTLTDEVKKIYDFSSVTCGNIIDSNDHNKSLDCVKAFDVQLSDNELNNIVDKISNMLSTKFNATNINCWQKHNRPRGDRKTDDKYITRLNFYYQIDDITNINDTLTEAKFGGYSYTYGVHAIGLDGRDRILAGAKTEEEVVKLAIEQAQKVFENPFMSSNEKYKYIDDMYISNDDTEQLVEPAGFDDYIDGLLSELRSKKDFKESINEDANDVNNKLVKKDESLDINEGQEAGDYDTALVDELQEALKLNRSLDEKIVNLQKQLSASNAQEMKLNEEIDSLKIKIVKLSDKAKTNKALTEKLSKLEKDLKESTEAVQTKKTALRETIDRDAKDRHALQESINSKDKEISQLKKQLTESEQRLSEEVANVKSLNEQLDTTHKDERQLKEKYTRKLEEKNALIEKYKNIAKTAVDNYINSRATVLGISANEIKNRLPESYSFKDINEVCDDLREYNINMNSLPFSTSKLNESINVSAKNIDNRTLIDNPDDEISDADMKLAEKFMR